MRQPGLVLSLCLALSSIVCAQTTPPPDGPQPQPTPQKRKFMSFSPPLSVANDAKPLKPGEKFTLFVFNTVNPFQFVATAASAGISQANDSYPSWGQGAEGYGKRYGAAYADTAASSFFGTFFYPTILQQDPRYFRKETGGFGTRLSYAITRIFVTRTDHGRSAPNASLWMGAMTSGGLANIYYPTDQQGIGLTFQRAGINIGTTAGFNVAREFWPDVSRRLFHRKK
ncbi:MAG TPA: hypothetical protein VG897_16350 [Terriglobales bacterium]|nr:hypothetical protein [Terriglobales bacterium]